MTQCWSRYLSLYAELPTLAQQFMSTADTICVYILNFVCAFFLMSREMHND